MRAALSKPHSSGKSALAIAAWMLVARVVLAVFGGYALSAAGVLLAARAMPGLARGEAVVLAAMLGFVVYLLLLLWAFAEPRLDRIAWWLVALPAVLWVLIFWGLAKPAGFVFAAGA